MSSLREHLSPGPAHRVGIGNFEAVLAPAGVRTASAIPGPIKLGASWARRQQHSAANPVTKTEILDLFCGLPGDKRAGRAASATVMPAPLHVLAWAAMRSVR